MALDDEPRDGTFVRDRTEEMDVREEAQLRGKPAGIAVLGDQLRIVLGLGDDDDQYIYRFILGGGLKNERIACPDLTSGHLAYDGDTLFLSQAARPTHSVS